MGRETIPPRNLMPSRSHWWDEHGNLRRNHTDCGVGILVASFAAYSEISVVRVEAKSIISAPTSVLWKIMMEVDKYPQWYSVMLEASGTPRLGAKFRFRVKAMDGSTRQTGRLSSTSTDAPLLLGSYQP